MVASPTLLQESPFAPSAAAAASAVCLAQLGGQSFEESVAGLVAYSQKLQKVAYAAAYAAASCPAFAEVLELLAVAADVACLTFLHGRNSSAPLTLLQMLVSAAFAAVFLALLSGRPWVHHGPVVRTFLVVALSAGFEKHGLMGKLGVAVVVAVLLVLVVLLAH